MTLILAVYLLGSSNHEHLGPIFALWLLEAALLPCAILLGPDYGLPVWAALDVIVFLILVLVRKIQFTL